jgi:hypothetical protein
VHQFDGLLDEAFAVRVRGFDLAVFVGELFVELDDDPVVFGNSLSWVVVEGSPVEGPGSLLADESF